MQAINIKVKGLVQGVGFRPFIYRIALANNLKGWVDNRNDGVHIKAEGEKIDIDKFVVDISEKSPVASNISSIETSNTDFQNFLEFKIVKSKNTNNQVTEVSPDIAVCNDCLQDMKTQSNRINYPFINCTNCGPRFSIIKDLPYDRDKTTMNPFEMCKTCNTEYINVLDRRFHAQPIACENCGPEYTLHYNGELITNINLIIDKVCQLIDANKIIAIKGIGGFFIACNATNEDAVSRLRKLKVRDGKPFAVMFKDIETIKEYAHISHKEEQLLTSWRKPIVIIDKQKELAKSVCLDFNTVGAMLPYMPIHYLLFEKLKTSVIVLTSGNISKEPIIINNQEALDKLALISDGILTYNREIHNRVDDSVAFVINNTERLIRRSRSYAPSPINVQSNVDGIIACGAELVNSFCVGKGKQAIMSQYIGDLKNIETLEFFEESLERYKTLFRIEPKLIVCDMHPDYLSTKYAEEQNIELLKVQHHHAHIVSCMAEHNINEDVIGIALDGTGYGTDGKIWGSEFMICNLKEFIRKAHFEYFAMPGGDKANKENWRMAISYLYNIYGAEFMNLDIPFVKSLNSYNVEILLQAIGKSINSPESCSAGRLFDAVSAILNIVTVSNFHSEAPMRLEAIIAPDCTLKYNYSISNKKESLISFRKTIKEIITDISSNIPLSIISAKFHNTVIDVILKISLKLSEEYKIKKVVLSGGVFQNKYISQRAEQLLEENNFAVFFQNTIPCNDGGIALGQILIAANRFS